MHGTAATTTTECTTPAAYGCSNLDGIGTVLFTESCLAVLLGRLHPQHKMKRVA
jgi:hypothetical protein